MRTFSMAQARAAWLHRQGLSAPSAAPLPGGWMRALGGIDPYLSLFARRPELTRAAMDAAVADDALWLTAAARGCIWLVPRDDLGLAWRVGDAVDRKRTLRDFAKLGVADAEVDALGDRVITALADGPRSTDDLRGALGDAVRSLGAAGKKLGRTTTLPGVLRLLEGQGEVRRLLAGGALDTNRYLWARNPVDMAAIAPAPTDPTAQAVELARRYFAWAAPATLEEFVTWSALGKRAARAAIDTLGLEAVRVDGWDAPAYVPDDLSSGEPDDAVHFLPMQDNYIALRGRPAALADPAQHGLEIAAMGSRKQTLGSATWLMQRGLIHRGELVGFWEWDPAARRVVWGSFEPLPAATREVAAARAEAVTGFIVGELDGNARGFAIDSDKAISRRAALVKAL